MAKSKKEPEKIPLCSEICEILWVSSISSDSITVPLEYGEDATFKKISKVLAVYGGEWHSKSRSFKFPVDVPTELLERAESEGGFERLFDS